jgi:hypothetical protein
MSTPCTTIDAVYADPIQGILDGNLTKDNAAQYGLSLSEFMQLAALSRTFDGGDIEKVQTGGTATKTATNVEWFRLTNASGANVLIGDGELVVANGATETFTFPTPFSGEITSSAGTSTSVTIWHKGGTIV